MSSKSFDQFTMAGFISNMCERLESSKGGSLKMNDEELNFMKEALKRSRPQDDHVNELAEGLRFPAVKREVVESNSTEGFCYVRLVAMLPGFHVSTVDSLAESVKIMKDKLGKFPSGMSVITELLMVNQFLTDSTMDYSEIIHEQENTSSTFIRSLMKSNVCFGWEEKGGYYHVSKVLWENCGCDSIICEHGFSARFVACSLATSEMKVGGTNQQVFDLDELFGTDVDLPEMKHTHTTKPHTLPVVAEDLHENYTLNTSLPNRSRTNVDKFLDSQYQDDNSTLRDKLAAKDKIIEGLSLKVRSESTIEDMIDDCATTIRPFDSSSNLSRYNKGYLPEGTIYTVNQKGNTTLGIREQISKPVIVKDIVQGYVKTTDLSKFESRSVNKIAPINGLANPFKNSRLNFLCHLHTAIDEHQKFRDSPTLYDFLRHLFNYKANTPSEELARQMALRTFCLKSDSVIANPFRLPFIEVGMILSDNCLKHCFESLKMEYNMIWFSEFKSLTVPPFHNEYSRYKENKLTKSVGRSNQRTSVRRKSGESKSSTVLSILR